MTVIAFRSRPGRGGPRPSSGDGTPLSGTFRSPRGQLGVMTGHLRLHRLVLVPRGTFVDGVFTGELREPDGTLVGLDSRRATAAADLVRGPPGLQAVVRPLQLDHMGMAVQVHSFVIETELALPLADRRTRRRPRPPLSERARVQSQ